MCVLYMHVYTLIVYFKLNEVMINFFRQAIPNILHLEKRIQVSSQLSWNVTVPRIFMLPLS